MFTVSDMADSEAEPTPPPGNGERKRVAVQGAVQVGRQLASFMQGVGHRVMGLDWIETRQPIPGYLW